VVEAAAAVSKASASMGGLLLRSPERTQNAL
jgi:hypothetical protein